MMRSEVFICDKCKDEQPEQRDMYYIHLLQSRHEDITDKMHQFEVIKIQLWCRTCREKAGYFPEGKHLNAKLKELDKKELTMEELLKNYIIVEKDDLEK